ncbi:metallophosphoesterase family protein [Nitratifractor sp.]
MAPLKIGILSDPHRRSDLQRVALEKLLEEGATHLLHAGDLCIEENLRQLETCGLPYAAVLGNNDHSLAPLCDTYRLGGEPRYLRVGPLRVKLMHLPYYLTPDADLIVYGHTHRFAWEAKGESLYLNPGEICGRESGACHTVLLQNGPQGWEISHYTRPIESDAPWKVEKIIIPATPVGASSVNR